MDKHKDVRCPFRDGPDAGNVNKRVRRHTWTDSPEQEPIPPKKQRHVSAPNEGASNQPGLLESILSGMKSPKADASKWEGQPNYSGLGGKKQESKWEDRLVDEKPHNQWWSTDPLQLESSSTAWMSESSKSDNNLSKHSQKFRKAEKSDSRNIEREKLQAKARSLDLNSNKDVKNKKSTKGIDVEWKRPRQTNKSNGEKNDGRPQVKKDINKKNQAKTSESPNRRGSIMREVQNTDKEFKKNMGDKKKFPKEMEGTKPCRSKSSWKGARNLGSTRKAWRPDRAYDFDRNYMEVNDVETPNDDFELARIV